MAKEDREAWIGVDLDGTLAEYYGWSSTIGKPIPAMVARVKVLLTLGYKVKIFTARGTSESPYHNAVQRDVIEEWCNIHLGQVLPITHYKDFNMTVLYDDRVVAVEKNTGRLLSPDPFGSA